jgi:hypothetical protein
VILDVPVRTAGRDSIIAGRGPPIAGYIDASHEIYRLRWTERRDTAGWMQRWSGLT